MAQFLSSLDWEGNGKKAKETKAQVQREETKKMLKNFSLLFVVCFTLPTTGSICK